MTDYAEWLVHSPDETRALGIALGASIAEPVVIALIGNLGSGKTLFTRGVSEGLGVPDARMVTSPTFTLVQEYPGRLPIAHFDTYRLRSPAEFLDLGPQEYFETDVCLIEWADRIASWLPDDHLSLTFQSTGTMSRRIHAQATGPNSEMLLNLWRAAWPS
jgi:tRNA threonylcarbamoyladenosine biosynthesis protein TsaE